MNQQGQVTQYVARTIFTPETNLGPDYQLMREIATLGKRLPIRVNLTGSKTELKEFYEVEGVGTVLFAADFVSGSLPLRKQIVTVQERADVDPSKKESLYQILKAHNFEQL